MTGILGLIILVLDVLAIMGIVKGAMPTGKKALWIILILVLPVVGLILYYLLGKKK